MQKKKKENHKFSQNLSIVCPVNSCQENYWNISDALICNSEWDTSGGLFLFPSSLQASRRAFWTGWRWFHSKFRMSLQQGFLWECRPWSHKQGTEISTGERAPGDSCTSLVHWRCLPWRRKGNERMTTSRVVWEVLTFISFIKFSPVKSSWPSLQNQIFILLNHWFLQPGRLCHHGFVSSSC